MAIAIRQLAEKPASPARRAILCLHPRSFNSTLFPLILHPESWRFGIKNQGKIALTMQILFVIWLDFRFIPELKIYNQPQRYFDYSMGKFL
jgi:hypothetical protein